MQELAEAERQANAAERGGGGSSSSNQLDEVMRATLASYDAARQAAVATPDTAAAPAEAAAAAAIAVAAAVASPSATQADTSSDSEASPAAAGDADGAYFGFRNKQDATDAFLKLLRQHAVPSTSNWGDAARAINKTSLWSQRIRDIPDKEKRQMFNRYKTQRAKEEKVNSSSSFLFIIKFAALRSIQCRMCVHVNAIAVAPPIAGRIKTTRETGQRRFEAVSSAPPESQCFASLSVRLSH